MPPFDPSTRAGDPKVPDRRAFLARVSGIGAAALAGAVPVPVAAQDHSWRDDDQQASGPGGARRRRQDAFQIRQQAALRLLRRPLLPHPDNGDEARYPGRIGSYTKCLPHDDQGNVDAAAYAKLLAALGSGKNIDFETIPMGGAVKLADPQAAYAFDLEGFDSHELALPAAPEFSSAWAASEMAELYWQALTRDVPFADYDGDPTVNAAANDLSAFSDFRGPQAGGAVTPGTLFRGDTPGDLVGPYLSQFLWKDVPYGPLTFAQKYRSAPAGSDYMVTFADCLARQRGVAPGPSVPLEATPHYIRNGRDMAEWLHRDSDIQAGVNATLMLLAMGPGALDAGNPYLGSLTQGSFVTFGPPFVLDVVTRVTNAALRAAWYQASARASMPTSPGWPPIRSTPSRCTPGR